MIGIQTNEAGHPVVREVIGGEVRDVDAARWKEATEANGITPEVFVPLATFEASAADVRDRIESLMKPGLVFGIADVAWMASVAPSTVKKWFDRGQLKGWLIPGSKDRRMSRNDVLTFFAEHGIIPRQPDATAKAS